MIFCMDSSAWMDGWVRDYPPDVFPTLWDKLDDLANAGVIKSTEEVYVEIKKKDDELHAWLKDRKEIFVPIEEEIQNVVAELLSTYPRLVDTKKNRSQADPFVIATAEYLQDGCVVTGEKASGKLEVPRIPDVCHDRGTPCITFLEMLREISWKF